MPVKNPAPPAQTMVRVVYNDGTKAEYPLSPLNLYKAGKEGFTTPIELTFGAAWIAAGKPEGDIEKWLASLSGISEEETSVPLSNGKPR